MGIQIFYGTVVLTICAAIHLGLIIASLPALTRLDRSLKKQFRAHRAGMLIVITFAVVVFGHTVHVWVWAMSFLALGTLETLETSVYFALTSYTTLGYGDIILADDMRLFGAFASVSGLLMFGVSTAFLVGVIGRVLPMGLR